MKITGTATAPALSDRRPEQNCLLLFRAGPLPRITDFQKGKMYMNSVQFFSQMEGEQATGLRSDALEKTQLKLKSSNSQESASYFTIEINGEEIHPGDGALLHTDIPNPSNIFIFSMAALADGPDGKIPGEKNGIVELSKRFSEFGDHAIIIRKQREFSKRLSSAIESNPYLFKSPVLEGGHGLVEYTDTKTHSGILGLFRKDLQYSWQREYRFCLGAHDEALNSRGALELNIGDISDISEIIPIENFLSSPITIKRRTLHYLPS